METNKAGLGPLASALYNHIMQYYNNDLKQDTLNTLVSYNNESEQTQQEATSKDHRQDQPAG